MCRAREKEPSTSQNLPVENEHSQRPVTEPDTPAQKAVIPEWRFPPRNDTVLSDRSQVTNLDENVLPEIEESDMNPPQSPPNYEESMRNASDAASPTSDMDLASPAASPDSNVRQRKSHSQTSPTPSTASTSSSSSVEEEDGYENNEDEEDDIIEPAGPYSDRNQVWSRGAQEGQRRKVEPQYSGKRPSQHYFREIRPEWPKVDRELKTALDPSMALRFISDYIDRVLHTTLFRSDGEGYYVTSSIAEDVAWFTTEAIKDITSCLMHRVEYANENCAFEVNHLFQSIILLFIASVYPRREREMEIEPKNEERRPEFEVLGESVKEILSWDRMPFYLQFGNLMYNDEVDMEDDDQERTCHLQEQNVKLFVKNGGVARIAARLKADNPFAGGVMDTDDNADRQSAGRVQRRSGSQRRGSYGSTGSSNGRGKLSLKTVEMLTEIVKETSIHNLPIIPGYEHHLHVITNDIELRLTNIDAVIAKGGTAGYDKKIVGALLQNGYAILTNHAHEGYFAQNDAISYKLTVAPCLLKCSKLDLRLLGLNEIKGIIRGYIRDQRRQSSISGMGRRTHFRGASGGTRVDDQDSDSDVSPHMLLELSIFLRWFRSEKILEYIFGPNLHLEVLSRSGPLLSFLIQTNTFSKSELLEIIWGPISVDQHRSVVHGVFRVLGDVCADFRKEHFEGVIDKLTCTLLGSRRGSGISGGGRPTSPTPSFASTSTTASVSVIAGQSGIQHGRRGAKMIDVEAIALLERLFEGMWDLTRRKGGEMSEIPFSAYTLLWSILQEPFSTELDETILQQVHALFQKHLECGLFSHNDRQKLVDSCIENLRAHNSVQASLRVLGKIISLYPNVASPVLPLADYLTALYTQRRLPDLFFDDLSYYVSTVKRARREAALTNLNTETSAPAPKAKIVTRVVTAVGAELTARLDFLRFLINDIRGASFVTSTKQADVVWDCLIADPLGSQERDEAFRYLEGIAQEEFTVHFFEHRFPELDSRIISEAALKYFTSCFFTVNEKMGGIRTIPSTHPSESPAHIVVGDLVGLEMFWNVALTCCDDNVGKQAITFLVRMYFEYNTNASDYVPATRRLRENLVNICVGHLLTAAKGLASFQTASRMRGLNNVGGKSKSSVMSEVKEENHLKPIFQSSTRYGPPSVLVQEPEAEARKFQRCLEILKCFMETFETRFPHAVAKFAVKPHAAGAAAESISVKLKVQGRNDTVIVTADFSDTIQFLRQRIAQEIDAPSPDSIRWFAAGREIDASMNLKTLRECRFVEGQAFQVMVRPISSNADVSGVDQLITISDLATSLLSLPEYFDQFFAMLQLEELYASQIWDLLMRLPTNSHMLQSIQELRTPVRWEVLLDSRSAFMLLYALQIVESMLMRKSSAHHTAEWTEHFIQVGGLDRLLAILLSDTDFFGGQDSDGNHQLPPCAEGNTEPVKRWAVGKACLGLLLKVVNFFADGDGDAGALTATLGSVKRAELMKRLSDTLRKCVSSISEDQDAEEDAIVYNALHLLLNWCTRDPLVLETLYTSDVQTLMFNMIVKCPSAAIRQTTAQQLVEFCTAAVQRSYDPSVVSVHPFDFFLSLLLDFLPELETYVHSCREYFRLAVHLLSVVVDTGRTLFKRDVNKLTVDLIKELRRHPIVEQLDTGEEDTLIIGLLQLLNVLSKSTPDWKIFAVEQEGLLELVFYDCLFEIPTVANSGDGLRPPKCKGEASRGCAFSLLQTLVTDCPENLTLLMDLLEKQLDRGKEVHDMWNYSPKIAQKSSCGHVGLVNLGATCYINSIIQQFYMNASFRQGLLAAPIKDNEPKNDSLLYQLQVLFSNLQESEKKAYEATPFCSAYKDYDGQPMNVNIQMDVDEYFNLLFDRLENSVSGTLQANLFKQQYGGTLVQQIKSRECEHVSERQESFFAIQCEVKNKKDITESLQLYVEGEMLDGDNKYFCASCEKHVDAVKRACIKQLPENLILHLKRFDFDMETMRRIKINGRFEFPPQINMEPYTLDYLTRKEAGKIDPLDQPINGMFDYELVGVLVHTGTADSGHYYSFIREREPKQPSNECRWFHFNDSNVELFDPTNIGAQCYGGGESLTQWDANQDKNVSRSYSKPYSAYMLFYRRRQPVSPTAMQRRITCNVPDDIYSSIWAQNTTFLKDKNIFDSGYYSLLWSVLNTLDMSNPQLGAMTVHGTTIDLKERAINLAMLFLLNTLSRAKERSEMKDWIGFLKNAFVACPGALKNWMSRFAEDSYYLQQVLLACFSQDVREAFVDLLMHGLRHMRQVMPKDYGLEQMDSGLTDIEGGDIILDSGSGSPETIHDDSLISAFLRTLMGFLPEMHLYWRYFEQYFQLLSEIASLGQAERAHMVVKHEMIWKLLDLYYADDASGGAKKRRMGDKFMLPPFRYLIVTLGQLICECDINSSLQNYFDSKEGCIITSRSPSRGCPAFSRTDGEYLFFSKDDTLTFFYKQNRNDHQLEMEWLQKIVQHFATGHWEITERLFDTIDKALDVMQREHFKPYFAMFSALIQTRDEFTIDRVKHGLHRFWETVDRQGQSPACTLECIMFASNFFWASECREVREGMVTYLDQWILYLTYSTEAVRDQTKEMFEKNIGSIIRSGFRESASKEEHDRSLALARRCYSLLKDGLPELRKAYKSGSRDGQNPYGFTLSQYFDVFKQVVITAQDKREFNLYFSLFFELVSSANDLQVNNSEDVRALIMFWHQMCEDYPENYNKIIADQRVREVFNHIYICVDKSDHNLRYHKSLLPVYFDMVLYCFKQSPIYQKSYLENSTFTWAFDNMVLGTYRAYLCDELKELFQLAIAHVEIRRACWRSMTPTKIETGTALEVGAMLMQHCNKSDLMHFVQVNARPDSYTPIEMFSQFVINCPKGREYERIAAALNVIRGFTNEWNQLASERGFGESIRQGWKNRNPFIGALVRLLNVDVPENVFQTVLNIFGNILELQDNFASNLQVLLFNHLATAHIGWVRAVVNGTITRNDLFKAFSGSRSVFTKYIDNCIIEESTRQTVERAEGVHTYGGLMAQLTEEERQIALKDFYEPYYDLICNLCILLLRFGRVAEAVRLVNLVTIEALPVRSDEFFEVISLILKSQTDPGISAGAVFVKDENTMPLVEEILFSNADVLWKDEALFTVDTVIKNLDLEANRKQLMICTTVTNLDKHISDLRDLLKTSTSTGDISDQIHSVVGHLRAVNVALFRQPDLSLASVSALIGSLRTDLNYLQSTEVINKLNMTDDLAAVLNKEIQRTLCQLAENGGPSGQTGSPKPQT